MKKLTLLALAVAVAAALCSEAAAQQRPGRGAGFGQAIWASEAVQKELNLTEAQVEKLREFQRKQREGLRDLRDLSREEARKEFEKRAEASRAALADILTEEQMTRYRQISLQARGSRALLDREVAEKLKLSEEQQAKIREIGQEAQREMRELFEGAREEVRAKMQALRTSTEEKVMAVLTDEQKAQWKEMTGAPFEGAIRSGRPGGPRRGDGDSPRRRSRQQDN